MAGLTNDETISQAEIDLRLHEMIMNLQGMHLAAAVSAVFVKAGMRPDHALTWAAAIHSRVRLPGSSSIYTGADALKASEFNNGQLF